MSKVAIGTRFFEGKTENATASLDKIGKWVEGARSVTSDDRIFIAVNVDADKADSLKHLKEKFPKVQAFAMQPWGAFVLPLGALALAGARAGADVFLTASAEVVIKPERVEVLLSYLTANVFMVGFRLNGHDFKISSDDIMPVRHATGEQVPWNTYAAYNLPALVATGIPLLGDSPYDPNNKGVEEVATIAVHQAVFGRHARLISLPDMQSEWDTSKLEGDRLTAHQQKMASKSSRPAAQLKFAGIESPLVYHIVHK